MEVEVTNRGEGAATGPGLVIGTIAIMVGLAIISAVVLVVLMIAIPLVVLAGGFWLGRLIYRMDARSKDLFEQMGFEDIPRRMKRG